MIQTTEGPVTFQVGGYLARGTRGEEWPISAQAFAVLYDEGSQEPDTEGFALYRPAPLIHQAVQIPEACTLERPNGGLFAGQAGDYLVRTVGLEGDYQVVDHWYFEHNYERMGDR